MGFPAVLHPAPKLCKYPVTEMTSLNPGLMCSVDSFLLVGSSTGSVGRRALHREDVHILAPAEMWVYSQQANKSQVMVINCMTSSAQ